VQVFSGLELDTLSFTRLALGSAIVAALVAWLPRAAAARIGLVSRRRRDRFGAGRIPLTGGVGLLAGVAAPLIVLGVEIESAWVVAALGFFAIGLYDDLRDLRPGPKFALQGAVAICAALMLVPWQYAGLVFLMFGLLVNASNYLDNMDGLLAGVALTQAVTLILYTTVAGVGGTLLVWALPGVLFLTLPPARVYLGDSGSHLIGALLCIACVDLLFGPTGFRPRYLVPLLLVFAVPLADMATVTISRLRRKRPVFRGGTDHLSHRLVRLGFPVPRAVLVLVLASAVCGLSSLFLVHGF